MRTINLSKLLPYDVLLEERDHLLYPQHKWLLICTMQEDRKMPPFEGGMSQVAIALL